MRTRAHEQVQHILAGHQPVSLPGGVAAQLDDIVREASTLAMV